jgi:membrane protease YdiL (CAAX protease family)
MNFLRNALKGRNDLYLYVIGVIIVIVAYFLGTMPILATAIFQVRKHGLMPSVVDEFSRTSDFSLIKVDSNVGLLLMILIFIITFLGLLLIFKIHGKRLFDMVTSRSSIDFKRIFFGIGFWMILGIVLELVAYLMTPENYVYTFDLKKFIPLFFICIFLLPIQTSTEELLFRSYLLQGLSLIIKQKWIIILITAVLFSAVHSANPEIKEFGFWTMQWYYIGAGVFLALITIWDDGLELALGVHAATNIYGALLVSYSGGVLQTDSVFKTVIMTPWFMIAIFYVAAIVFILVCYRKYNWKPLKEVLFNDERNLITYE